MDQVQWLYSDTVKDHFTNPRNVYNPDESFVPDAEGVVWNIKCGDQMMFMLKIKDDVITDVRWKTYGCASAIASTSMLSEVIKGMNIRDAYKIKPKPMTSAGITMKYIAFSLQKVVTNAAIKDTPMISVPVPTALPYFGTSSSLTFLRL